KAIAAWLKTRSSDGNPVPSGPVLMQDFTGVPAVVDLAAMRAAVPRPAAIRSGSTRSPRSIW
ncbi:hypothetical protein QNM99_16950, partial [Pseudomonas sp. PCH446]